jgi:hypothetical protein
MLRLLPLWSPPRRRPPPRRLRRPPAAATVLEAGAAVVDIVSIGSSRDGGLMFLHGTGGGLRVSSFVSVGVATR